MYHDALGRMMWYNEYGAGEYAIQYDGLDAITDAKGYRFVHGAGDDEPIVQYDGSGTSGRRFLHSDERGSIISVTDSAGALIGINKYDEYGQVAGTLTGRFGYTGQFAQSFTSLYYYKARIYDPELGRFLQTDPIGYADSPNLYAYVLNDPVNLTDPLGLRFGLKCVSTGERTWSCSYYWIDDPLVRSPGSGNVGFKPPAVPGAAGEDRDCPRGKKCETDESAEDQCAGYDTWKAVQDVTGVASAVTGTASDALKFTPAMITPHGQALQKSLQLGSTLTGIASAGSGLVLGVKYGDVRSAIGGVSGLLSGSLISKGYQRYARAMGYKNTDLSTAIVKNVVDAFGGDYDLASSGKCASK